MSSAALGLVLLSALLHAAWNAAAKGSSNPAAFVLSFDATALVALLPLLLFCDLGQVTSEVWWLILASGVVHGVYGFWLTRAYEEGDLNLVYPIARSTPAFVPLLAVPLLGERLSLAGGLGIALVVVSLWLLQISRQGPVRAPGEKGPVRAPGEKGPVRAPGEKGPVRAPGERRPAGHGATLHRLRRPESAFAYLTLASTVGYSLTDAAAMDRLGQVEWTGPAPRAFVFMVLIQVVYLPIFALLAGSRVHPRRLATVWREQRWRLLAAAAGGFLSYSLVLEAMRRAPVSYVVAVRQSSVLFALVLGVFWLRERPAPGRVLGIVGTVVGVGLIALHG